MLNINIENLHSKSIFKKINNLMKSLILFFSILSLNVLGGPFTFYTSYSGIINSNVQCIEQGEKFIWIGTDAGINRILFEGLRPIKFSKRKTSVPVTALEDDGEFVWAGLKGKGVYKMLKKNYKLIGFRKDVLRGKEITNIKRFKKGLIVYTESQKFSFYFGKEKYSVANFESKKYNPSIEIDKKILKINNGFLSRFNSETKSFRSFENKIDVRGHLIKEKGVLLATSRGLVVYSPNDDVILFGPPKVELSAFELNRKDTFPVDLNLNWGEHIFDFDFTFEELGPVSQISLVYTLKTKNKSFEEIVSASNGIELSGLEYGTYDLEVIAKNDKGITSENALKYKFSIANPLKDSIWRYIMIMISLVLWTTIVFFITRVKFKKEILILEDALLEKTNKLNQIEKSKYGLVDDNQVRIK